jgi:NitT/TauT family transport system permease protein
MTTTYLASGDEQRLDRRLLGDLARRRRTDTYLIWTIRIGVFVLATAAWQFLSDARILTPLLVSSPAAIGKALGEYLAGGKLWTDAIATFNASLAGVLLGSLLGIGTGVAFAKLSVIERAFRPYVTVLNALPRVALAPLFLVWFGLGLMSKVVSATSIVYFVLLINTVVGLRSVDRDIAFLADALAMSPWQRFWLIDFPTALPAVAAGLRLGVVYSVLGVIVTEMVASYSGLGQALVTATTNLRMDNAFAIIILITAIATALDLLVSLLERRFRWNPES